MKLGKFLILLGLTTAVVSLSGTAASQDLCTDDDATKLVCGVGETCVVDDVSIYPDALPRALYGRPYCRVDISDVTVAKDCRSYGRRKDGTRYRKHCLIEWNGPITQDSSQKLVRFLQSMPKFENPLETTPITVTSDGGSVLAALELGRQMRSSNASVHVWERCASACVFLLASGVHRSTFEGDVVIHRPYSLDTSRTDLDDVQKNYDITNQAVATYLREMNLPVSLLDAMLRVPPHQGKRLSEAELEDFGLNQRDPVYEQAFNAFAADKRGLTMSDYLSRKQQEENCLANNPMLINSSRKDRMAILERCGSVWE